MQEDTKISVDELEAHVEMRNVATGEVIRLPASLTSVDDRYANLVVDYTKLPAGEWLATTSICMTRKD